jgi:hypothetical protein
LFDSYVRAYGGEFWSVDLRPEPSERLARSVSPNTHLHVGDSIDFLRMLPQVAGDTPIDLFYLDSYDLDWSDPAPSEQHGLEEWNALLPCAGPGTLVLIDDTPASHDWIPRREWLIDARASEARHGVLPGKGAWILRQNISANQAAVVWHGYNVLLSVNGSSPPTPTLREPQRGAAS